MKNKKIVVCKSLTLEKQKQWVREEYTLEVELENGENPEDAKMWASSLIDMWLEGFKKAS